METANIQSVVENNIVSVALMNIQPSSYNPRKHFDEVSLAELAESIRQQGVLQPIGVRPIADTDRFEIVFGERRYRAALMVELTEISAVILHVSDETAAEMAVTENLQRKDVTPIEEANAYQKLMESGRYDVQSLAEQFGKNENYIRTRLKFVSLIPEIAELLEKDEITISVASEICRYGTDIQKEVYYKHLKDSDSMLYDCWRGLKAAEVAKFIERDFTTDLSRYAFDKTLCASCPHNTNNMMLFCEGGCGNCANRSCLAEMNASYLVEKAVQFVEQYPSVSLCYQDFNNNMIAVERLTAMGYEVEHLNTYATPYPETPVAPEKEEYDTIEEYEEAYKEYEQDFSNYMEKCKSIHERIDTGELTFYISIGQKEITLCYMASAAANADMATEKQLSPVEKLNKEVQAIRGFNIIATANNRDKGVNDLSSALKRRFNTVILPLPDTLEEEVDIVRRRVESFEKVMQLPAEKPALDEIRRVVTIFRELRQGATGDGKTKLKSPSGTLSTAEAISVVNNGLAMAGYFGDGQIHAEDLVSGILGAVVKDPVQDKVVWQEYMETVVKNRDGWKDIYRASRDMI